MNKQHFRLALAATLNIEGEYSADRYDPGGETYMGISRVYWPHWPGWLVIDEWLRAGKSMLVNLTDAVEDFYYVNFWCRVQGDAIADICPDVAFELFDTAVNLDVPDAVRFLQTALNMQNQYQRIYPDLQEDGKLGPKTINCLRRYLSYQPGSREKNEAILLACMNGEQYIHYKNKPRHEYFRGWFARL